jgi:hypothetical protein
MANQLGHFDLDSPEALFAKVTEDYSSFFNQPNSSMLFNLIAGLYHLAEWICPERGGKEPASSFEKGTPEQQFYWTMWHREDWQLMRELCNRAKHFNARKVETKTDVIKGARAGLMRAGDSLGQTYFTVDGADIRDTLMSVFKEYKTFFQAKSRHSFTTASRSLAGP